MRRFLLILFSAVFLFAGYNVAMILFTNHKEAQYTDELERFQPQDDSSEALTQSDEALRSINHDYIGYLAIPKTNIQTPVVQSSDNQEYLTLDFYRNPSRIGTPFKDARAAPFTVLYGHHTDNQLAFSALLNFQDATYFQEHPTFEWYTNQQVETYTIIGVGQFMDTWLEEHILQQTSTTDLLTSFLSQATYQRPIASNEDLMVLSTCFTYTPTNQRWVVIATKNEHMQ